MKMTAGPILISVLMAAACVATASADDSVADYVIAKAMPFYETSRLVYHNNAATMSALDSVSRSVMSVKSHYDSSDRAVMEELGTGRREVELSALTYRKMNSGTTVWGHASFTTARVSNVRWTDCIDYLRVAPYVLGDSVGGYLSTRSYSFGGGWCRRRGQLIIGVEADYRAEIVGRSRDPRLKIIVSDLNLGFGIAIMTGSGYLAGLSGSMGIYSQNSELDFYNPVNDTDTYTLTGLGSFYRRFMGNSNKNSGHSSTSFSAGAQFVTTDRRGFKLAARYSQWKMSQQLRSFNNLTLAYTDNKTISAIASWRSGGSIVDFEPLVSALFKQQRGTENLFGTSQGSSYDKIGSRKPYSHDYLCLSAGFQIEARLRSAVIGLKPGVTYISDRQSLSDADRRLSSTNLASGLMATVSTLTRRKWLFIASAGFERTESLSNERILTRLDLSSGLGQCVVSDFEMLSSSKNRFSLGLEAGRPVRDMPVTLSATIAVTRFCGQATHKSVEAALRIYF